MPIHHKMHEQLMGFLFIVIIILDKNHLNNATLHALGAHYLKHVSVVSKMIACFI